MKIFITGGTGFVGRPTVAMLKTKGHQLMILSRTAKREAGVKVIKGDLATVKTWQKQLKAFKPDVALHLAWEGIPDFSVAMCTKNIQNSLGLFNLLGDLGCKKVVVAGTCFEYGAVTGKIREDRVINPHNAFTAAKHAVHLMGVQIAKEKKMQFVWTRPFYIYGPRQRAASLIPYIIQSAREGVAPVLKNPFARNDFIYVDDVARAFVRIVEHSSKKIEATYNIGSGKLTSVADIVKNVYDVFHKPSPVFGKIQKLPGFWADISGIKKDFGWKPQVDIVAGINKTINYLHENNS